MFKDETLEKAVCGWALRHGAVTINDKHVTTEAARAVLAHCAANGPQVLSDDLARRVGASLSFLMDCVELEPASSLELLNAINRLRDLHLRRELKERADGLNRQALDFRVAINHPEAECDISAVIDSAFQGFKNYGTGMRFGLMEFDEFMGGLMDGQIFTIIAGSGIGKTMLAMNLVQRALAYNPTLEAGFFSWEMDDNAYGKRSLAICGDWSLKQLHEASNNKEMWDTMASSVRDGHMSRCWASFQADTLKGLEETLQRHKGTRLIAIDYLQFFADFGGKDSPSVNQMMLNLKTLAKRNRVAIILLAQIDKAAGRDKEGTRPCSYDAVGGHGIKANSDWCFIVHRENNQIIGWFDKDREPYRYELRNLVYKLDYSDNSGMQGLKLKDMEPIEGMPE